MPDIIKEFTDLKAWQEGHGLVIAVYSTTRKFPKEATYSLADQMRRSSSSITANIAEGFGRWSYKEKIRFYYLAHGSLTELKDQLLVAKDVDYLKDQELDDLLKKTVATQRLLQGLIKKTKSILSNS
ncbi:MAG: four helix bundle protein [Candidatus Liptonbacteria bacterium]|nr:four helix bundle protein [Candidatus Liptonbacteria bacterium]